MITLPSPAKLNLFLKIIGKRNDGYHNLQTIFQFIDWHDLMTFSLNTKSSEIQLITKLENIHHDENLIIKAAKLLQKKTNSLFGATISIQKRLPIGGGMGGGSSNAATTLLALNYLWKLNLSHAELIQSAKKLGADVPVFIFGETAFAEGIGDKLTKTEQNSRYFLIIQPNLSISTVELFSAPNLNRNSPQKSLQEYLSENQFENDFEPIVRQKFPEINQLIIDFYRKNKVYLRLTGTGCCLFCECDTKQIAENLAHSLSDKTKFMIAKSTDRSLAHQFLEKLTHSVK